MAPDEYLDRISDILHHEHAILQRLDRLAQEITADYRGKELTVLAILHGSMIFAADLLRRIPLPLRIESLSVASYHGGAETSGVVTFNNLEIPRLAGQHVLLLDDILDTGGTLYAIRRKLEDGASPPASLHSCVLLRKRKQRARDVDADYVGFDIDNEFVVGYGLDYRGHYRNLPYIALLDPPSADNSVAAVSPKPDDR